jgi:hypothetical protein
VSHIFVFRILTHSVFRFIGNLYPCKLVRDETVEVGAKLYELDTDAVASISETSPISTAPVAPVVETPMVASKQATVPSTTTSEHRSPSIKFLGKDGWEALRKGQNLSKQVLNGTSNASSKLSPHAVTTIVDDSAVKNPMYGRPKFTDAEIEALLTGGATLAPLVLSHSTGAKFKL